MTWLIINTVMSAAMFFTTLCRLQKTTKETNFTVRLAFFIIAALSMAALVEPIARNHDPAPMTVILLTGGAVAQILLAIHWNEINLRFYSKKKTDEPIDWPIV